jgi:hypothetical protein
MNAPDTVVAVIAAADERCMAVTILVEHPEHT